MVTMRSYGTVVVTGASSGLGEEYALQLAPHSARLVLVARRGALLQQLADRIRGPHPGLEIAVITADLAEAGERIRLVRELADRGWATDLLVNNAGLGDYGEFVSAGWPRIEAMLRLNMEALTHLAHLMLPGMVNAGTGALLNVSSLASLLHIPDFAVYAATKAYVTSFSEALRIELKDHGIRVLAVCPGPVHTEFGSVAQRDGRRPGDAAREWFYVPREQVVAESLAALERDRPRCYPGLRISAAAMVLSALPLALLRRVMGRRPRKI